MSVTHLTPAGEVYDGGLSDPDSMALMIAAMMLPPYAKVFEIGTFEGRTSYNIAKSLRQGGNVYTLDLPPDVLPDKVTPDNEKFFHRPIKFSNPSVEYLHGDSLKFDFTPYYWKMNMVFVDGNHDEPYISSDIQNGWKMLAPNGVLWCHDYNPGWPEVKAAIDSIDMDWILVPGTSLVMCRK